MRRYLRLLLTQLHASTALTLQYRVEFVGQGLVALVWTAWALVPLLVVFGTGRTIAGWRFEEALVVLGWFTLMKGILEGAVNPSLASVVDHIRKGTLDFVLLKPADAQFLVSTARFQPWRAIDVVASGVIFAVAFARLGRAPDPVAAAAALVLLGCAALVLYALWILVVSAAFYVVKVDNLSFLFSAIFDAARWPVQVFRGGWRLLFTLVVPLALMTTYPAMALLGTLSPALAARAVAGALAFAVAARLVWLRSIARYTSASS